MVVLTLLFQLKQQRTMSTGFAGALQKVVVSEALVAGSGAGADI